MNQGGFIPYYGPKNEIGMKPRYANLKYEGGMKPGRHV